MSEVLMDVQNLSVYFKVPKGGLFGGTADLKAVNDVSFQVRKGETLGIVGESGCGKSTLGRAILHLIEPTDGSVLWMGEALDELSSRELRAVRSDLQIIFQDPLASLNPRMTIGEIIAEPLITQKPELSKDDVRERVRSMMGKVGLLPEQINRYPHEFSGGQCQRIGIARAMILEPKLVVCDEAVSALDVSIQAQIINLLMKLQKEFGLSLIFISHNLSVVRHISQRIMVLYLGKIMELGARDLICSEPQHPYTQALIASVPSPDPRKERNRERITLGGDLPSPLAPPSGCVFRTRCPYAEERCARKIPLLEERGERTIACHRGG
ncbi:ABC transporter ATP-binding protein [Kiloniella sp. b19]|uniref:ABC transporter ATP-binding protein n=1 Tax=Kiloniella sp. GXU_MW_B19 TaxID=3141326 RepID=UPI0031DF85E1